MGLKVRWEKEQLSILKLKNKERLKIHLIHTKFSQTSDILIS